MRVGTGGGTGNRTFRSLRNRNFRLYYFGQMVSQAGTFMQVVGQSWLVFKLTGSGTALGFVATLQFLPLLMFGGIAGVLVDRVDRRRLYIGTQTLAGAEALLLGALTIAGVVDLWMVYVLAFVLGLITAVDQPTRQTFLYDMVGPEDITNAVSLQMTIGSTSRALGPAFAGITIAVLGIGPCFLLNAGSFAAVICSLLAMRPGELHPVAVQPRRGGQFREGLSYVWEVREVLAILVMAAIFIGIAWEFEVVLPLLARLTFHGGAGLYGVMSSMLGVGALCGGMIMAGRGLATGRTLVFGSVTVGLAFLAGALAPVLWLEMVALFLMGVTSCVLASATNSTLQLRAAPHMRGRVMALYTVATVGTRPIGGPMVGWIGQHFGPRAGVGAGGVGVFVGLGLWWIISRTRPHGDRQAAPSTRVDAEPALGT